MTGFDVNSTWIVTYSMSNEGVITQNEQQYKLADVISATSVVNEHGTLISGEVDEDKIVGEWHNYNNKIWANIKTYNNGLEAWWVWIPRYAYSLEGTATGFSCIFIDTDNEPCDSAAYPDGLPNGYVEHPAFNAGSEKKKGFWMSKYEATEAQTQPTLDNRNVRLLWTRFNRI